MTLNEATYVFENAYGDSSAVREAGEIVNAELDRLRAALKDISAKSDDCYNGELWAIHGIASDALKTTV